MKVKFRPEVQIFPFEKIPKSSNTAPQFQHQRDVGGGGFRCCSKVRQALEEEVISVAR